MQSPLAAVIGSPRRFTVSEVLHWCELGLLPDEHLELIDGELLEVTPQGPTHSNLLAVLARRFTQIYPNALVRQGAPIVCSERTMPEPDVTVVAGDEKTFAKRLPNGNETTLVVEVTNSSHAADRAKAGIYATAMVPVYWLVDVPGEHVEVYEGPQPDGTYRSRRWLAGDDLLTPPGTDACWPVRDLF